MSAAHAQISCPSQRDDHLVNAINYTFETREMSSSQKLDTITLIFLKQLAINISAYY